MYELQYKKKAIKALAKINDPYYTNIIEPIDKLAENPRPNGYKKLTGRDGYYFVACRSGGLRKPKLLFKH